MESLGEIRIIDPGAIPTETIKWFALSLSMQHCLVGTSFALPWEFVGLAE